MKFIKKYGLFSLFLLFFSLNALHADPYWDQFRSNEKDYYAPRLRIALGAVSMQNEELDKFYGMGQSIFLDYNYFRIRSDSIFGLDLYGRYTFKHFDMGDKEIPPEDYAVVRSKIIISGIDAGARFLLCFDLLGLDIDLYIQAAPRFIFYGEIPEDGDDSMGQDKQFFSIGAIGGSGIEIGLFNNFGFFLEWNYGYTPVSDSRANTEGIQFFAGLTWRTRAK